ncbi:hypothetical protein BJX76DRAFT_325279 [Aspergillus varians]
MSTVQTPRSPTECLPVRCAWQEHTNTPREPLDPPQPVRPLEYSPKHVATSNMQFPPYDLDAAVWKHMLHSFAWFESVLESEAPGI